MVIHVKDVLFGCDTNEDGEALFAMIRDELRISHVVTVDFRGVIYTTTSFVNSAFVALLDEMPLHELKSRLHVIRALPQITDMIRRRISDESQRIAA